MSADWREIAAYFDARARNYSRNDWPKTNARWKPPSCPQWLAPKPRPGALDRAEIIYVVGQR